MENRCGKTLVESPHTCRADKDKELDNEEKLEILEQIDVEMDETLIELDGDEAEFVDETSMYKLQYKRKKTLAKQKIGTHYQQKTVKIKVLKIDGTFEEVVIPHFFLCPICLEPFQRPATLICGHTFCSFCLLQCNIRWSFRKCPYCYKEYTEHVINVILESDVEKALKRSVEADVSDQVITLVKYNNINAFATGNISSIRPGYLSKDMREWTLSLDVELSNQNLVEEYRAIQDHDQDEPLSLSSCPQFIPLKICVVQINSSRFKGILSQTFPLKFSYFAIATRPHRGAYVISRESVILSEIKFQNGSNNVEVYDPLMPKFNEFYEQFIRFDDEQNIFKLVADEPILGKITLERNESRFDTTDTENFLRISINLTYKYENSQFLCPACKELYRLPVELTCGCDCCFSCARDLFVLKLPCLGCGEMLKKRYGLNAIDKKLILQLYSKIPAHAPMLDKSLPVQVEDRIGILIDDPSRVNCWVLFGPGDVRYVHSIELKPVEIVKMELALMFEGEGIIYRDKEFGVVSMRDGKHYYADRSCISGREITKRELILSGYKLVDDLRADIVQAKIDGSAEKLKLQEKEFKEIKGKVLERIAQQKADARAKGHGRELSKEEEKSIIERRKKLEMVDFRNPDAKFHPGNQMLMEYGKQTQKPTQYQFISEQHKNWIIEAAFKNPDLTFLCSACWWALREPCVLECGHICCRRCASLCVESHRECEVCGSCVENFQLVKEDVELREELICSLDAKVYFHGINVGMMARYGEQHCMISGVNTLTRSIQIKHSLGEETVSFKELVFEDVVGLLKDSQIELDSYVIVLNHELSGIEGIVLNICDESARVFLETGLEEDIIFGCLQKLKTAQEALTETEILDKHKENERERRNELADEIRRELGLNPRLPQLNVRAVKSTEIREKLIRRGGSENGMIMSLIRK